MLSCGSSRPWNEGDDDDVRKRLHRIVNVDEM